MRFPRSTSSRAAASALALAAVCSCLSVGTVAAGESAVNWPIPDPPAGANPAAFPAARNDWMVRFGHILDRTKRGGVDLVFDGDSITDNWQKGGREVWAKRFGAWRAVDYGISADRTENLLWRLDHGQVDSLHPGCIVLLIGTNNLSRDTEAQIAEGIAVIVRDYQKHCPEATILLQAIFPRAELPSDPLRQKVRNVNALLSKMADGNKVVYVDFGDKFLQPDGTVSTAIMADFLHPTTKGYEIWADALQPYLEKLVGGKSPASQ